MYASLALLVACAGLNTRTGGMSTLAGNYQNIIEPVLIIGIGAEQDAGGISAERADNLRNKVILLGKFLSGGTVTGSTTAQQAWDVLLPFAEAGIDARVARGDIGAGVGASLKEVLRMFGARLLQLNTTKPPSQMIGFELTEEQLGAVEVFSR